MEVETAVLEPEREPTTRNGHAAALDSDGGPVLGRGGCAAAAGSSAERAPRPGEPTVFPPEGTRPRAPAPAGSERLTSLDAFRGLTILGMLVVNNATHGMARPQFIEHAPWGGGIYLADLVFPWFLLIVGVAVPWAYHSARRKGVPWWRYGLKVLGRTASLVLLGCLIDSSLVKRPVFDLGVLQLIGLAYCIGALMYALPLRWRLASAGAFLVGHWALLHFGSAPGVPKGSFTEVQNIVHYLNQVYLQPLGLNGLISAIPTTAMVLLGTATGDLLRGREWTAIRKVGILLASGSALMVAGWLWSLDVGYSKALWTASYILFTAGSGMAALALCYWVVDVKRWRAWAFPLVVLGMNAIIAYVAPILTKIYILEEWSWRGEAHANLQQLLLHASLSSYGRVEGGWLYTTAYIGCWWIVLLLLYEKRVFLRV